MKQVVVNIAREPGFTYDVGVRSEGGIVHKTLTGITESQAVFSNLQDGNYEAMVRRVKPDGSKGQWFTRFVPDAACPDLIAASISEITGSTAKLNYTRPTGVLSVEYRLDGGHWIPGTGEDHTLTGLAGDTTYKVEIRPVMSSLVKGNIIQLQFTTAGSSGPRTSIRKVEEICFGSSHSNTKLRVSILGGLASVGTIYRLRLLTVTLGEVTVQAGSTMASVINQLFSLVYGVPGSVFVSTDGQTGSFELMSYSKSMEMNLDYSCGDPAADETSDYDFIMI